MKRIAFSLPIVAVLIGCDQPTAPTARPTLLVAPATVERTRVVTAVTLPPLTNLCTGETIVFSGSEVTITTTVTDGAGGTRTILVDRLRATGVSDEGNDYQAIQVSPATFTETAGVTSTQTVPVRLRLVSRGAGQDITLDALLHITTVDDQDIVKVESFQSSCLIPAP